MVKILLKFLTTVVFVVLAFVIGFVNRAQIVNLIKSTGLIKDTVLVSGTGSMYPTFPLGSGKTAVELSNEIVADAKMLPFPLGVTIFQKTFFGYTLHRGDIVSFSNSHTKEISNKLYGEESGYIKRVIGLPNDSVEIKGGLVYLNGEPQKENYTALPHSTFGGTSLSECSVLKIPEGKVFVLGDNRKASADSRSDLGLIDMSDIDHVIPLEEQKGLLDKNWRDTSLDLSDQTKIKLDSAEFIKLLNIQRAAENVKPLTAQLKLNFSSELRAKNIIKFNDFSFAATKSDGFDMKKAMASVDYSNIVWGEVPVQGYYTASELIDNLMEFPSSKDFVLNKDFSEVGLSSVEGSIDNCPTQVIVLHFAGYIPPNYEKAVVNSWQELLTKLTDIQPSWKKLTTYKDFYKDHKKEIDRLNYIIDYRIDHTRSIVTTMTSNQWLNESQKNYTEEDAKLNTEQAELANKINSYIK